MFNTLAQTGTKIKVKRANQSKQIVYGEGADLSNSKALWNRGQKKMITQKVVLSLIDVAKKKGNTRLTKALWNTYHCQTDVVSAGGRMYGKYCKNRFCSGCCGIRKAEKIRRFLPVVKTWTSPQFITLTAKSVPAKSLPKRMKDMNRGLRLIIDKYKKKGQRGTGIKLVGFKSLECNFNPTKRLYNPHIHLIVENKDMADLIVKEWLQLCTPKFASQKAQLVVPVIDKEKSLVEVIKYSTKQFTDPNPNDKEKKASRYVYTAAMYNIIEAMEGIRIFDRFGFNLPKSTIKQTQSKEVSHSENWKHSTDLNDWLNSRNQRLTGYLPSADLIAILTNNIDKELT